MARDKSTQELTLAEQQAICDAHVDYALSVIGSADTWCRWQGQANANGITNEEVQASCDVEEANCLAMKNESFAAQRSNMEAQCTSASPLGETFMRSYVGCDTTVGQLEACGVEQLDVLAELRNVPCSEFTVERRAQINTDLGRTACGEIEDAPCAYP